MLTRFFIPSKLAAGGFLHGDHRTYSDDINASHRASLLWNTATGTVVFRVTESCRTSQGRLLDLLHLNSYKEAAKYTPLVAFLKQPKCRPAFRISDASRESIFRSSDQRRFSNLAHLDATADGALSLRLSIINSYTNSLKRVPGAWSVDNDIVLRPAATPSGFAMAIVGNGYPNIESTFYPASGSAVPIAKRSIQIPHPAGTSLPGVIFTPYGRAKVQLDEGGGDAAYDKVSWATCATMPPDTTMRCEGLGARWSTDVAGNIFP